MLTKEEKIPSEPCEREGGRRVHKDRSKRKRPGPEKDNEKKEQCVVCGGMFKKGRGLKIHQAKAGCRERMAVSHRRWSKSEVRSTQESHYSDATGHVELSKSHTSSTENREGNIEMRWNKEVEEEEGKYRKLIRAEKREKRRGDGGPGRVKAKCRKYIHQEEREKEKVCNRRSGKREENSKGGQEPLELEPTVLVLSAKGTVGAGSRTGS